MFIYPYKIGSKSVGALRQGLGAKSIKLENSNFKGSADRVVINWGCSQDLPPEVAMCRVINPPDIVRKASNKLSFFETIEDWNEDEGYYVTIPSYTTKKDWVRAWLNGGDIVLARHKLNGHNGDGIELLEGVDCGIPDAPLYVKYIPKKQEYRVHVVGGQVVDVQRKSRRHDVSDDEVNWRIRNYKNGFIFAHSDLNVPHGVREGSIATCEALGLDFGAVDVIYSDRNQTTYIIGVNTAPALAGTTLEGYVERFKNWDKPAEKIQRFKANPFHVYDTLEVQLDMECIAVPAAPVVPGVKARVAIPNKIILNHAAEKRLVMEDVAWADDLVDEG